MQFDVKPEQSEVLNFVVFIRLGADKVVSQQLKSSLFKPQPAQVQIESECF